MNAALAALRRFYRWAVAAGWTPADVTAKVKPVPAQPLAPKGFTSVERQRLRREAERAGPMPDAIVTTLLNTGLRVDEAAMGAIFRGKRGPYTDRGVRSLLAQLGRHAGVVGVVGVHPHRFRHDAARRLVEAVDLPTVASLLGHSWLDTVRIYSQPDEAALERATAVLETQ